MLSPSAKVEVVVPCWVRNLILQGTGMGARGGRHGSLPLPATDSTPVGGPVELPSRRTSGHAEAVPESAAPRETGSDGSSSSGRCTPTAGRRGSCTG